MKCVNNIINKFDQVYILKYNQWTWNFYSSILIKNVKNSLDTYIFNKLTMQIFQPFHVLQDVDFEKC